MCVADLRRLSTTTNYVRDIVLSLYRTHKSKKSNRLRSCLSKSFVTKYRETCLVLSTISNPTYLYSHKPGFHTRRII